MLSLGTVGVLALGGAGGVLLSRQPFLQHAAAPQRLAFGLTGQTAPAGDMAVPNRPAGPLLVQAATPASASAPATPPLLVAEPAAARPPLNAATPALPNLPEAKPAVPALATPLPAPASPSSPEKALMLDLAKRLDAMNHHLDDVQEQLRKQIADDHDQLRAEMDTRDGKLGGRLDELQHREDIAELAAQQRPAATAGGAHAPKAPRQAAPQEANATQAHAEAAATTHPTPVAHLPRYHIMAGGPDVAVLMGPDGNSIEVTPGSDLGPYGHVTAVTQRGADYVVTTEHGVIR